MANDLTMEQGANLQFARHGFELINDTTLTAGPFVAIQIINATVFNVAASGTEVSVGDNVAGTITYPAGMTIYGMFTNVKLVSGVVHCIKQNPA